MRITHKNIEDYTLIYGSALNVCHSHLEELIIPEKTKLKEIWITNNDLTELIIPEGIELLACTNNKLRKLILPKTMKQLYCRNNKLVELLVPPCLKDFLWEGNPWDPHFIKWHNMKNPKLKMNANENENYKKKRS